MHGTARHKDAKAKPRPKSTSKLPAVAPPPAPAPVAARMLLRVHSAKQLHHVTFSHGVYCKMYVGETLRLNGSQRGLFSKMTGSGHVDVDHDAHGKKDASAADSHGSESDTHHVFRTKTVPQPADAESAAVWDENFDLIIPDVAKDILSVRVKSTHRLYQSVLGVCAIPLKQLQIGHAVDKWVPLLKGTREVATLRLQIVLSPIHDPHKIAERSKADLQADIKTALAANQSADEAIERLLASATFKSSSNRGGAVVILPDDEHDEDEDDHRQRHEKSDHRQQRQPASDHQLHQHKSAAVSASKEHVPAHPPTVAFSA